MRIVAGLILISLAFTACFKKKVVRKIEGDWHCYKLRDPNGLYSGVDDYYHFDPESKSASTATSYTYYGNDTVNGQYQVLRHGVKIYLVGPFTTGENDTVNLEDIGTHSMVMTTKDQYVLYFER